MEDLIGKKIRGFKFDKYHICGWNDDMSSKIGSIGTIEYYADNSDSYSVSFEDAIHKVITWHYPSSEIKKHLIKEDVKKIEDYSTEELKEIIQQIEQKKDWKRPLMIINHPSFAIYNEKGESETGEITLKFLSIKNSAILGKMKLMYEIESFAKFHNGDWVADWADYYQLKWGIGHYDNKFKHIKGRMYNDFLFGISVKSEEIAEAMLKEFKDELEIYLK